MDARTAGYGYAIPMPRFPPSNLGDLVFFDEQGVVRTMGILFDDGHFKRLLEDSQQALDFQSTSVVHPSLTVALAAGCIGVKPLSPEECSK